MVKLFGKNIYYLRYVKLFFNFVKNIFYEVFEKDSFR